MVRFHRDFNIGFVAKAYTKAPVGDFFSDTISDSIRRALLWNVFLCEVFIWNKHWRINIGRIAMGHHLMC